MGEISKINMGGVEYDIRDKVLEQQVGNREPNGGMGYVILRKDKTFAEQMTNADTIYEVRYDFDLNGAEVTIPEGCVLDFQGGSLNNGTIVGSNTLISSNINNIFKNIVVKGTWINSYVKVDWFNIDSENLDLSVSSVKNALNLCSECSTIEFGPKLYYINMIRPKSNMTIVGHGDKTILKLIENSKLYNHPIQINNTHNVRVMNLCVDGNYNKQSVDKSKYGIYVVNSQNITIENVSISECSEGIFLGYSENPTFNVEINNCKIYNCYRNAMALSMCERVNINNLSLIGYKESSALLDIEFHLNGDYVRAVSFNNCNFVKGEQGQPIKIISNKKESVYGDITFSNCNIDSDINIMYFKNVHIVKSKLKGIEIIGSENININSCISSANLPSTSLINIYSLDGFEPKNINIVNCEIKQLNTERNANGVSISGAKNIAIVNSSIYGFNRGIYIAYENDNIHINDSYIKENNIGIGVTSNTYKHLFINNSLFENDIDYKDLVPEQTFFSVESQGKDNDGFVLLDKIIASRFRIKGARTESNALNGEIFESNSDNIPYFKNSKGNVFQIGERHYASPSPPSGTPKYIGERFLDTTYNIYYNAVYVMDSNGNPTYDLKWAAEIIYSYIDPLILPDFIGQKYINKNNNKIYMATGFTVSDWVLITAV